MNNRQTRLEAFLHEQDEAAWERAVEELLPSIHEVDRAATRIWFAFFPLALLRALEQAEDPERLARELLLQGRYYLKDQIDSSHHFMYGHRYWQVVKRAVAGLARAGDGAPAAGLAGLIREEAARVASTLKRAEESLLVGITAAAFMTLRQVGLEAFEAAPGAVNIPDAHARKSPEQVLRERARDDRQGLFGLLRTNDRRWTVVFYEADESARFRMINGQEVASAAATDKRDWHALDPRCTTDEGPIPVQCRSASCGTCWVGVLGGAEKLSAVAPREARKIKEFGYIDTDEARPLIRLSCQAQGFGAVSIVIPPWNGVFGKHLRRRKDDATRDTTAPDAARTVGV